MSQAFPNTISRGAAVTRTGADGDGHHLVHGEGVRRASQSCGESGVLAARRFPVAARAWLTLWPSSPEQRSRPLFLRSVVGVSATFRCPTPPLGTPPSTHT